MIILTNQLHTYLHACATAQGPIIKQGQPKMEQTHAQTQRHAKAARTIIKIQSIVQAGDKKDKYTYIHIVYN
jgi:phosphopantothenoylcysteine synthetase/decarboxylase